MGIALAIHGGAWNVPDTELADHRDGVARALRHAWGLLHGGASAVDTVTAAVRALEDDPLFNAGTGSHLNRLGKVELDASIMSGDLLEAGAVAAVERIRNPVDLARAILEDSDHVLLVGKGARRFAREQGIQECRSRDLLVGRARETYLRIRAGETDLIATEFAPGSDPDATHGDEHMGTVGAVARDANGCIVAATSTGGTLDKYPGRVGDSPLIGSGTYADSRYGGASCTGWGEGIMRVVMAKAAIDRIAGGLTSDEAASSALGDLGRIRGHGGMIMVDKAGVPCAAFNTPRMARGLACARDGLRVGVDETMETLPPS
ncbi:MAG: peptidase T [Acidobacteria bacterium]|nr:peptidase T [Acidobacteriota bacterium]